MKILEGKIVCGKCGAKNDLSDLNISFSDGDSRYGFDIDFICRECDYVEYVFIGVEDFIDG